MTSNTRKVVYVAMHVLIFALFYMLGMFGYFAIEYKLFANSMLLMSVTLILILVLCIFVLFMAIAEFDKQDRYARERWKYIKRLESELNERIV